MTSIIIIYCFSSGIRRDDIFSLEKCQNDLEKMKQDCMMQLWLSEVDLLGEDLDLFQLIDFHRSDQAN